MYGVFSVVLIFSLVVFAYGIRIVRPTQRAVVEPRKYNDLHSQALIDILIIDRMSR